jgi:hypothetical protein
MSGAGSALVRVEEALHSKGSKPGARGSWQCPAHDDRSPSLSVKQGVAGAVLHCFAGCSTEAVLEALALSKAALFDEPRERAPNLVHGATTKPRRVASYTYTDRNGEPLRRKVRLEPGPKGRSKAFVWERPDTLENGREVWVKCSSGDGNPGVLYRLPEVLEANEVHVHEGEKACDATVKEWEVCSTCPPAGWDAARYVENLKGADAIVWADRDAAGLVFAAKVHRSLVGVARSVRVVQSRVMTPKADAFDHAQAGFGPDDAIELDPASLPSVEDEPESESDDGATDAHVEALRARFTSDATRVDTWFTADGALVAPPPREYLVEDFLPEREVGLVVARGGTGKGFFLLNLAATIATATSFGRFAVRKPRGVVVLSREDDREELQRRFVATINARFPGGATAEHVRRLKENLRFVNLRGVRLARLGDLLVAEAARVVRDLDEPGLVILDPLGKMLPEDSPGLNQQEGACLVHEWLDVLGHETGCAALLAHHVNKAAVREGAGAGAATGSQLLEDLARYVVALNALSGDDASEHGLDPTHARGFVSLVMTKANYAPPMREPFVFERVEGGALLPREVVRPDEINAERALRVLEALFRESGCGVGRDAWRKACAEAEPPLSKHAADAARESLRRAGFIREAEAERDGQKPGASRLLFEPSDGARQRDKGRFSCLDS